ncbi:MAG: ATP phosphoribosyltransferase regulatory subunit [Oscillospiraceae bacterium]|nr:ATP phosphoribosyltransferase regulatory subunit [Oscillospiraceae bacterium]
MNITDSTLKREERAIYDLRKLYEQYGYKKYKMSKFEEYDLYLENKSFLPSQQIISFTDLNGKLMALKPDVTLSIAKNAPFNPSEPEKLYYNENVYRTPHGSNECKEIMQLGLECIGDIDLYTQCEIILLACKSLQMLSEDSLMVVSHMGFVSGLLESCALNRALEEKILKCIGHKNAHEVQRLCEEAGLSSEKRNALVALTSLYGNFAETLDRAEELVQNEKMSDSLKALRELAEVLVSEPEGSCLKLDFSVINDLSYYNGLIFQGFIDGVPNAILAGGRYDKLMEKLGKQTKAAGFAVYVDQLERCNPEQDRFDVDVLLTYEPEVDTSKLTAAVKMLTANGRRVRVQMNKSEKLRYKQLLRLSNGGLEILETND